MSNNTLFDVEEGHASNNLAFQNFGSNTIAPDVPTGRISPSIGGNSGSNGFGSTNLFQAEQRFENSLNGATKSGGILNLDFYSAYFDVDTMTVITRCWKTLVPIEDYTTEILGGVPDLYGPFWVPTTLIFSLFLTSSLSASISAYLAGDAYTYDFTRLGAAVSLVYTYALGLPLVIWAALKYWAGATERSAVEIISLYGYATTVWIITSWLTLIPYSPLRILLSFVATVLSAYFLLRNLYPVLVTAPNVSARLLLPVVGVLHFALGLALWFGFLAGGKGVIHTGKGGLGEIPSLPGTRAGNADVIKRLFL